MDALRDAAREAASMDKASDYSQNQTPSVGSILIYNAFGGERRTVVVTDVEEVDPEKGRPTFSGKLLVAAKNKTDMTASEMLEARFGERRSVGTDVWGYWSQIVRIISRGNEVRS